MAILGDSKIVSLTLLDGVVGNLNPKTTNVYDLGTTSLKWRNLYGDLKGNADSATKATQDGNGKIISSTYLPLAGGTMTGKLNISVGSSGYADSLTSGGLNLNNSNIVGLNSIYTADGSENAAEGIHFYRDSTHVDTLWMNDGNIYFVPNRTIGTATTAADSQKVGRFTTTPTTGQVVVTDGTTGGMKTTGYTIAASVPSDAKFTDTTYAFAEGSTNGAFSITPSGGSAQSVKIHGLGSNAYTSTAYLPLAGGIMTGNIRRYYSAASSEPMITAISNNHDILLFEVGHGTAAATAASSSSYRLKYAGTNSAPNNYLQLIAVGTGSPTVGLQFDEKGQATFPAKDGFTYSGIGTGSDDSSRPIWFSYNGVTGRPVYDNDFKYNPALNRLDLVHASGKSGEYRVTYGSTVDMWLGIGSGNVNHGLYDSIANKWMISADASGNVTVNGNAATATDLTTNPALNIGSSNKQSVTVKVGSKVSNELLIPFAKHTSAAHYSTTSGSPAGVLKVKIKKKTSWMLSFTLRVYQAYSYQDFVVSGYNYGSNHWYSPKVVLLGGNLTTKQTVSFGYDNDASGDYSTLWVSIPIAQYTGADIFNVCNGYTQIDNYSDTFEIINEATSTGTVQTTIDVHRPWYRNEIVSQATSDSDGNAINTTYIKKSIGTAKGDIIYWSAANTPARLGIGSAGQVLKVSSSGIPTWSSDIDTDTKNTAGSTDTSSKIFLIGATSQAANPQTYSDNEIYAQNGTLYLVKTQDLSGTANNKPALIVGGADTAAHMEFDANEIQAKTNDTSAASLYLNNDGGLVTVGSGGLAVSSLTASQAVTTDANKKLVSTNLAVSDPTASGAGITYIATISQSAVGKITATKSTVRSASTSQTGVVQLSSATNSTSETLAATAKAVKTAYDLANNHKYWANIESTSAASYNKAPEVANIKINGNTSATAASTKNVTLQYDSTLEVLNFVFS